MSVAPSLRITKGKPTTLSLSVTPVMDSECRDATTFNTSNDIDSALAALGVTPASDEERAKRIHKHRSGRGELCFKCARTFDESEPIYRDKVGGYVMLSYSYQAVSYCESCAPPETPWHYREQAPCDVCNRDVHYPCQRTYRKHLFCSEVCSKRHWANYQRDKRLREREVTCRKECGECSTSFTALRSDAKYCSAACKQKAYRQRGRS